MDEQTIRRLIREELGDLIKSDRYTINKHLQLADGKNIQLAKGTGTKIGLSTSEKLGFFGLTPITQPNDDTGVLGINTYGTGPTIRDDTLIHGDVGSREYTLGDIVGNLKRLGILASS